MGSCCASSKILSLEAPIDAVYSRHVTLSLYDREHPERPRKLTNIELTRPYLVNSRVIEVSQKSICVSECILPGADPKFGVAKDCQDRSFVYEDQSLIFIGLYDGHGAFGHLVSEMCTKVAQELFSDRISELASKSLDPVFFLRAITDRTESILRKSSIDVTYSGTTEVLIIIEDEAIHCAVVGDSRAILGTNEESKRRNSNATNLTENVPKLKQMKDARVIQQENHVFPIQLTVDQKPNDAEEMRRICAQGGEVRQLIDQQGKKIGPFRVWKAQLNTPGIAMSRSLGDSVASEIGVISTPVVTTFPRAVSDKFLIVASDGVWDVMDNDEVVQFVEHYRGETQKILGKTRPSEISPRTVCIAQLLCEEARVRWLAAVEEEGVAIDDISCIILEFLP